MVIGAVLAACGFLAAIALVVHNDAAKVANAIMRIGWSIIAIVAVRAVIIALAGTAWGLIARPMTAQSLKLFVFLRWLREAVNALLPVASVGGEIVGGRLLTFTGVSAGLAAASILADLLIQAFCGLLFAAIGLMLLAAGGRKGVIIGWALVGIVVGAAAMAGFYVAQRAGFFSFIERRMLAAARWSKVPLHGDPKLHENLQAIYANHGAIFSAILVHLLGWFFGTGEVWIALEWMGAKPGIVEAMVLESLAQGIRTAAFPVPGSFGVQEAAFLLLGRAYGIPVEFALALALVKRVPDVTLGLPGLFFWQLVEARHIVLPGQATSINETAPDTLRQAHFPDDRGRDRR